jgi:hypothetical protein
MDIYDENIFNEENKLVNIYKKNLEEKNKGFWTDYDETSLKCGDIISVYYSPDSQKYIYTHTPECGVIQTINKINYINPATDNYTEELSIMIINHKNNLIDINKSNLSLYSQGYIKYIQKYCFI